MSTARVHKQMPEEEASLPPIPGDVEAEEPRAWEEIAAGRYMPRRIRGSCRGRVLG